MSVRIKIIALVYVFILAGIIILAGQRGTNYFAFLAYLPFGDKIGHFCLMGIFSLLVNLALKARRVRVLRFDMLLGSLIVFVLVAAEEFSQIFVGGRSFDWADLLADAAGIFVFGWAAQRLVEKRFRTPISRQ